MDLSAMLTYQNIDNEISKIESTLMQTPTAKEYMTSKKAMALAQDQVVKQNAAAGELVKQMEVLIAEYDALEKELKEAESAVPDVDSAMGADFFIRNVQKLIARLKVLASEISKMSSKIVELNQNYASTMAAGKEAKKKLGQCRDAYEAEKSKFMPQATEIQQKMQELEKNCSEEFLTVYKRLKKIKKLPVIVPLNGYNCGGCFMEVAGDLIVKLSSQPFVECPSCGRILYKD